MWSLPDINKLNAAAAANANALRREARRKRKPHCQYPGCTRRAVESVQWFDIFSDDPKGLIHVCAEHPADSVSGFFTCAECERLMVHNYTWEKYATKVDGETFCLRCAAEAYVSDPAKWIDPRLVKEVVLAAYDPALNGGNVPFFSPKTGVLNVARCPHVLGVKQPLPAGIKLNENAEFDAMSWRQISGRPLLEIIQELNEPFVPVLDAAYQFAVSIGIYVRAEMSQERKEVA